VQHAATRCNTLQHAATQASNDDEVTADGMTLTHNSSAPSAAGMALCTTLQHTATYCNTLQQAAP